MEEHENDLKTRKKENAGRLKISLERFQKLLDHWQENILNFFIYCLSTTITNCYSLIIMIIIIIIIIIMILILLIIMMIIMFYIIIMINIIVITIIIVSLTLLFSSLSLLLLLLLIILLSIDHYHYRRVLLLRLTHMTIIAAKASPQSPLLAPPRPQTAVTKAFHQGISCFTDSPSIQSFIL